MRSGRGACHLGESMHDVYVGGGCGKRRPFVDFNEEVSDFEAKVVDFEEKGKEMKGVPPRRKYP